ncbi:hypothetical protein VNI00_008083 [Paramarasmius palmivorus]|uniref:Uncharacterized protein n=1 Tax=Paramarasmius palmivorus TaxID=297713 RepID=A0AAW0CZS9_9AGAR
MLIGSSKFLIKPTGQALRTIPSWIDVAAKNGYSPDMDIGHILSQFFSSQSEILFLVIFRVQRDNLNASATHQDTLLVRALGTVAGRVGGLNSYSDLAQKEWPLCSPLASSTTGAAEGYYVLEMAVEAQPPSVTWHARRASNEDQAKPLRSIHHADDARAIVIHGDGFYYDSPLQL